MENITIWLFASPQRGRLHKRDGDARRLALGCKLQILVSLRVFGRESRYICPFRYRQVLCIKKFTKNALTRTTQKSPLGVTLSLSHTHIFPTIFRRASPSPSYGSPPGCFPPFPYPMLFMITQELYASIVRPKQQIWIGDGESTFSF